MSVSFACEDSDTSVAVHLPNEVIRAFRCQQLTCRKEHEIGSGIIQPRGQGRSGLSNDVWRHSDDGFKTTVLWIDSSDSPGVREQKAAMGVECDAPNQPHRRALRRQTILRESEAMPP